MHSQSIGLKQGVASLHYFFLCFRIGIGKAEENQKGLEN